MGTDAWHPGEVLEEGLLILTSENRWRPDESCRQEGGHVCQDPRRVPGPAAQPSPCPAASPPPQAPYSSCTSRSAQEYHVITKIMLLQVAAENYSLEPEDPFWAWFQAMEPLSEAER